MEKKIPAVWETWVPSMVWENSLEKEIATHSIILTWRISWMEEPGGVHGVAESQTRLSD